MDEFSASLGSVFPFPHQERWIFQYFSTMWDVNKHHKTDPKPQDSQRSHLRTARHREGEQVWSAILKLELEVNILKNCPRQKLHCQNTTWGVLRACSRSQTWAPVHRELWYKQPLLPPTYSIFKKNLQKIFPGSLLIQVQRDRHSLRPLKSARSPWAVKSACSDKYFPDWAVTWMKYL